MGLSPGTRLGPYEVVAPIGAGGMGEVWKARDTRLDRYVAIKVLPEQFFEDKERRERFEREARLLAAVNHANIAAIHSFEEVSGRFLLVQELLEGEPLRKRLSGPLPPKKAIEYAVQVAHGLAAAHEKGIVHRDLKPENLFVTRDGHLKILDFGLARRTVQEETAVAMSAPTASIYTEPGTVLGTVGYMSPEQVLGKPLDARSDLFSLGVVLYEMLSGRKPFHKDTAPETMTAILKEEPPDLSGMSEAVTPGLDRIVRHCLEKEPEGRFQTARDVAFALESLSQATTGGATALRARRSRRKPLYVAAAGILLAGALAAAFFLGRGTGDPTPPTYRKLTFGKGTVASARFTPDGNSVVYSARWDDRDSELYSVRLESPVATPLEPVRGRVSATHRGEMAVVLPPSGVTEKPVLATVPLSGGTPRPVVEGVTGSDWSPDGKTFAVIRSVAGRTQLEYPPGKVLFETAGGLGFPRISPRGDRVAFAHWPVRGLIEGSVVVVDTAGQASVLSEGWSGVVGVSWSPDGREVWFTAGSIWGWYALYSVTLDRKTRLVLQAAESLRLLDVFHDGRVLLASGIETNEVWGRGPKDPVERSYSWLDGTGVFGVAADGMSILLSEISVGGGLRRSVYLRRLDGTMPVRLSEGRARGLSHDGAWALSVAFAPTQEATLLLVPTGPGETKALPRGSIASYHWASFFPEGKKVLILGNESGRPMRLFAQDIDRGLPRAFSPEGWGVPEPSNPVSPDGNWVAATQLDGAAAPVLVPVEGGEPRPIEGLRPSDVPLAWTRDGQSLFVREAGGRTFRRIVRFNLKTRARSLWKELRIPDPTGAAIAYAPLIACDGECYFYTLVRALNNIYVVEGLK